MVYSDCALIVTACDPDLVRERERPGPETVQAIEDTSVAFQETVDEPPIATREGEAEMVACGFRTLTLLEAVAEVMPSVHVT